jgi:iron complex outermembrane receptor protein
MKLLCAGLHSLRGIIALTLAVAVPSILRSQPAPAALEEPVALNAFTVEATTGESYGASNLGSATRLKVAAENVPQSISVINANLIRDLGAYNYDEAVRYTPGVTERQNVPNGSVVRGFLVSNRYRNGFRVASYESDMTNVDRIEIIKGPSASIAGASESGGFVNMLTKKPRFTPATSAAITVGNPSFVRGQFDTTGPVADKRGAYRLILSQVNSNGWRDGEKVRKTGVFPSFTWNFGKRTQWTNEFEYFETLTPPGFGTPYLAPVFGNTTAPIAVPAGVTPRTSLGRWADPNVYTSEPGDGRKANISALYSTFTHQFNRVFAARQSAVLYRLRSDVTRAPIQDGFFFDNTGDLLATRTYEQDLQQNKALRLQGDIAAQDKFWGGLVGGQVLAGYEVSREINKRTFATGNQQPISLLNPIHGLTPLTPLVTTVNNYGKSGSWAAFANAQVSFWKERVILTGGYRRDFAKASWTKNNLNGRYTNSGSVLPDHVNSPLYGLTVKPTTWLAVYGVYSEAGSIRRQQSLYPNISSTDPRQVLTWIAPITTNEEFGVKTNFFQGNLSVSLARYKIVQHDNVRNQTDFSYPGGQIAIIEAGNTAKGWELEWSGNLTKQLMIYGGYANMATVAPGFKPNGAPRELRGVPDHKFQLFTRYSLHEGSLKGLAVKAGIVTQTSVWGRSENTYRVPGATRYDTGLDYSRGKWWYSLTVANFTNTIFPQAAIGQGSNTIAAPRTIYLTASQRW